MMVVAVLITSCQVSLEPNKGLVKTPRYDARKREQKGDGAPGGVGSIEPKMHKLQSLRSAIS